MDEHVTVTRESVTPGQLFDLAHEMLDRLDRLEWTFSCLVLLSLDHLGLASAPDRESREAAVGYLRQWIAEYRRELDAVARDRQFLDSPE